MAWYSGVLGMAGACASCCVGMPSGTELCLVNSLTHLYQWRYSIVIRCDTSGHAAKS